MPGYVYETEKLHEAKARMTKVFRLVRACDEYHYTHEDAADFTDADWSILAQWCGEREPSEFTRSLVLHVLQERENG